MDGTVRIELEPLLDLEVDFFYSPGLPGRMNGHPDFRYPPEPPEYEFREMRVFYKEKLHRVPDWLAEILESNYLEQLAEATDEWIASP